MKNTQDYQNVLQITQKKSPKIKCKSHAKKKQKKIQFKLRQHLTLHPPIYKWMMPSVEEVYDWKYLLYIHLKTFSIIERFLQNHLHANCL